MSGFGSASLKDSRALGIKQGKDRAVFGSLIGFAKVVLVAASGAGGVLAWQNPEATAIVVIRVVIDRTTATSGACTLDFGTAANATTSSDNLIDALNANAAAAAEDNIEDKGTNGKARQRMDAKNGATDFLTGTVASGTVTDLVGNAYIEYLVI